MKDNEIDEKQKRKIQETINTWFYECKLKS